MKSLRDRKRIPCTSLETVYKRTIEVFQNNKDRALKWYLSPLAESGLSPYQMCKNGKAKAVLEMLNKALITQ